MQGDECGGVIGHGGVALGSTWSFIGRASERQRLVGALVERGRGVSFLKPLLHPPHILRFRLEWERIRSGGRGSLFGQPQ